MEEQAMLIFCPSKPLPWLLPFLNILQPPLLGSVLFFFPVALGVLF